MLLLLYHTTIITEIPMIEYTAKLSTTCKQLDIGFKLSYIAIALKRAIVRISGKIMNNRSVVICLHDPIKK